MNELIINEDWKMSKLTDEDEYYLSHVNGHPHGCGGAVYEMNILSGQITDKCRYCDIEVPEEAIFLLRLMNL